MLCSSPGQLPCEGVIAHPLWSKVKLQCERKVHKQDEIEMPHPNPTQTCTMRTIFHLLALGLALGVIGWCWALYTFPVTMRTPDLPVPVLSNGREVTGSPLTI